MGKGLTFDNLYNHICDFTNIENGIIDVSNYYFVEPVGIAILKAIEQEIEDVEILLNPRIDDYANILNNSQYNKTRTYIRVEIVDMHNITENKEKVVNKIMDNFDNLNYEDKEDLKSYLDYMVGEILNNAIQHSLSPIGAIITGQYFPKKESYK